MKNELNFLICLVLAAIFPAQVWSCTIFCAKDKDGQMWAGNNEDFYFYSFSNWIGTSPKTDSTLSYLYFAYPDSEFPQGGINEAGLFYDGNAVEASVVKDSDKKIPFPGKNEHDILFFILGHCKTVPEVIELFKKYNIPWMTDAQLNFADREGNMGIITADSAWVNKDNFQVSTNYNLSHNDDDYKRCWRYPIAHSLLSNSNPGFELFSNICYSTSQRKGAYTIYSNVHNLTTGEIWFYYGWDYENPYKTTFENIIAREDTMILFRDLFAHQKVVQAYNEFKDKGFYEGLEILNSIKDPEEREGKINLLILGALFEMGEPTKPGEFDFTKDNELIYQIIKASNNEEILLMIANHNLSESNKKLVEQKLSTIKKSGISNIYIIGFIIVGGIIYFLMLIRLKRVKQQLIE